MQSLQAGYADDRRVNHSSSRSLRDDHDGDFGDYGISMIPQRSSQSQDDYLRGEDYTDRPRHSSDSPPGTGAAAGRRAGRFREALESPMTLRWNETR